MNHASIRRTRATRAGALLAFVALVVGLPLVSGCATVRPYQREHLVSRIMAFDADAKAAARRTKSLEAREGSTGGVGGAGGGCACSN